MPFVYDIDLEKDPIYIEGFEKGFKEGVEIIRKKVVENILLSGEFSVERVAYFVDVSVEYVLNVQERLKKEGKL